MSEPDIAVLRQGSLRDLKPLRERLREAGFSAELVPPPGGCST